MEAAFRSFPRVPPALEKIRDLSGAVWYNDSKATQTTTPAEVGPRRPAPVPMVVLRGGQVQTGRSQAWLKGPIARPGPSVLSCESPRNVCCLLASSGYGGEVTMPGRASARRC